MISQGSSPLARGTRNGSSSGHRRDGLIPARAGNTTVSSFGVIMAAGSSPLARGTLSTLCPPTEKPGLIPARAGNTALSGLWASFSWAHPRSRGEHPDVVFGVFGFVGSSPLARGTHHGIQIRASDNGLIPARAGNTHSIETWSTFCRAHPRSRGEHIFP